MTIIGSLIAFAGVAIGSLAAGPGTGSGVLMGDVLSLVGALAWACYTALLRHRPVRLAPLQSLLVVAIGGAIFLVPAMLVELITGGHVMRLSAQNVGETIGLALVASIAVYRVYGALVSLTGATTASMSMFLVPIYALGLGSLWLGELITAGDVLAAICIITGLLIPHLTRYRLAIARI